MKQMKIFLPFFIFIMAGSNLLLAQPCASYTSSVSNNVVTFTNTSTCGAAVYYYWNYRDGGSLGVSQNATHNHTFPNIGSYLVTLTVRDSVTFAVVDTFASTITITSISTPPGPNNAIVFGNVANTGGNIIPVFISADRALGGTVTTMVYTDSLGNYIDTMPGPVQDSTLIKVKITNCFSQSESKTILHTNGVLTYMVNLDYCQNTGCRAAFSKTQAMSGGVAVPGQVVVTDMSVGSNLSYLWDYGDGTTSTLASPSPHTYSGSGPYVLCLTVSDTSGCSDTYCDTLSVDSNGTLKSAGFTVHFNGYFVGQDELSELSFKIYPNPAVDEIFLEFSENAETQTIVEIFNLSGQKVYEERVSENTQRHQLDVSDLNKGLYFIKLTNKDRIITERIILE